MEYELETLKPERKESKGEVQAARRYVRGAETGKLACKRGETWSKAG